MTIKRCYPVLVGASVAENQLCNGESVTVPNGHKYYLKTSGTESLEASTGMDITGLTSGSDMVIDLTQLLGTAIADYVYSLGNNGIAKLRSWGFLKGYQAYNAGTIESVEATAKVVRDENGENAVTYPLGSDVLRGIFKLDANNKLYACGDRKTADGTITRKYGVVDLGTLNWTRAEFTVGSESAYTFYTSDIGIKKGYNNNNLAPMICGKYLTVSYYTGGSTYKDLLDTDKSIAFGYNSGNRLHVRDDTYTDSASFKTAMSGVMLVYEKATPTTEQSSPFTSPQVCYPDGTEEFVTENGVPVGHETKYQL